MAYTIKSSERTRKTAAEAETKALLYLMNFRDDSNEIHYFVVDFFNDLTGMDRYSTKLWDIQSKGAKNTAPKAIGKELVTLFKNYLSEIDFAHYILFMGGVSKTVRVNDEVDVFDITNVTEKSKTKIIEGLKEEALAKEYIDNSIVTNSEIIDFLDKVLFVIDCMNNSDYVKSIIQNHPKLIIEDAVFEAIFNEIRDAQSSKKNTLVEGITIQTTDEALNHYRHLTGNEIRLLTLQRIINKNPVESGIPMPFVPIYNECPPEKKKGLVDECKQSLCRALFNKNSANAFWSLFESVYEKIVQNPNYEVQEIYNAIDIDIKRAAPDFDVMSLKYFIATVKDGIENDN